MEAAGGGAAQWVEGLPAFHAPPTERLWAQQPVERTRPHRGRPGKKRVAISGLPRGRARSDGGAVGPGVRRLWVRRRSGGHAVPEGGRASPLARSRPHRTVAARLGCRAGGDARTEPDMEVTDPAEQESQVPSHAV